MLTSGQQLRMVREQLGLTMRDVEIASSRIAAKYGNDEFMIALSRLSDIETKGVTPSIYRVYSLSVIYHRDIREILTWYGIDMNDVPFQMSVSGPPLTHPATAILALESARIPVCIDPSFDPRYTANLGRVVEQWGVVPLTYLAMFAQQNYTYAYIGSEDFTMYPIVPPGSFLQIDESRHKVEMGMWRSEYERPIYFVETRDAFLCAWCSLESEKLVLQPHPLSPEKIRTFKYPQDAEIVGQVVGIAMRLIDWHSSAPRPRPPDHPALN